MPVTFKVAIADLLPAVLARLIHPCLCGVAELLSVAGGDPVQVFAFVGALVAGAVFVDFLCISVFLREREREREGGREKGGVRLARFLSGRHDGFYVRFRPLSAAARPLAQFCASAVRLSDQVSGARATAPGMALAASRAVDGLISKSVGCACVCMVVRRDGEVLVPWLWIWRALDWSGVRFWASRTRGCWTGMFWGRG